MLRKLRFLLLAGGLLALAASTALAYSGRQTWDLHRINRVRSAHGVRRMLRLGAQMTRRAQYWANHLASLNRGLADDISGQKVCWRAGGHHYGANTALAGGYSNNFTRDQYDLEHSPPHLANMVNRSFRWVGIGIASSRQGLVLVQDYCGR
jgi:uncharacterized protein YkwD